MHFIHVDTYHGLKALTLFYIYGLINIKVETNKRTRWNVTMKLPRISLFPETQLLSSPSFSALLGLSGENHIPQGHFALPAKDRLQLELSMTSSPAQPCVGGLDAHPFKSNQST